MFNDYFQKMVEEMYEAEGAIAMHEIENTRFTATCAVKDLQVIDAIASRFSRSRADMMSEILSHAAFALFISLEKSDREEIAKAADEQIEKHMKKNMVKYERVGLGDWASVNYAMDNKESDDA